MYSKKKMMLKKVRPEEPLTLKMKLKMQLVSLKYLLIKLPKVTLVMLKKL